MNPAALVAEGAALLSKVATKYPDVLVHAVSFVRNIVEGNKLAASRDATNALVSRFWRRPRPDKS